MPLSILTTKLHIPQNRPSIVHRPRLVEQLNEGMQSKLTLLSAPAGFGKTTLVSEWLSRCGKPAAWLSLDEADSDLTHFLTYFTAALQTIEPQLGAGLLSLLQNTQPPAVETILTTLVNEIAAFTNDLIFVLDDYHAIEAKAVDETLTFLLYHLPPRMHLLITTREDPLLPLARLRARGQLTEIRAADLRFTPEEAGAFLNQMMGLNLSTENVAALETRTEGWIAGLQLAALSMQGHQDSTSFINSFTGSHHFVLDYLVEEVLHQQTESIQTFLLQTSILDRMCGPLCDAVLDAPNASGQRMLEYLEHANLFVVPLDNERGWYRYHHLFRDLLRQRLGKPVEFANFHIRASQWYAENGDIEAAFHHAVTAGDFVRAAALAEAAWQTMNSSFQSVAWLGWVMKLPEEVIRVRPVLCTQLGRAYSDAGKPEASELRLQDAERYLQSSNIADETQLKPLPAMIALIRASNAQMHGDLAATVKYAELALKIMPDNDLILRAEATITIEVTQWARGNLESALKALGDWMESMTKMGNHVFVVASAFASADMLIDLGRLHDAEWIYKDALIFAAQHGSECERITAHHHLGLSVIYRQRGEDALAHQHLKQAAELGQQTTLVDWQYRWLVTQAKLQEAAGELETALTLLDEAKRFYVQTAIPDLRPIAALKAHIYLKQGRADKTRAWLAERELSLVDEVSYLREFEYLTLARLEIANAQVNNLLARLIQSAETQKRLGSLLEILMVQILAHEAQGNRPQALEVLKQALTLAEPEGYVRIFVDEGKTMRSLIEQLSDHRDYPLSGYAGKLLAAFTQPGTAPKTPGIQQQADMIEPLSERELEVLKLLRTELSGPEIAGQLIVSLNTFRTHTKNIFNKLGVNNRRTAVRRAEELDLF